MHKLSLFVDQSSLIYKIDPISKMMYAMIAFLTPYILPHITAAIAITALSFSLLLIGRVFRHIVPILGVSLLLILSIVIVQGLFYPDNATPLFQVMGLTFYQEGSEHALLLTLRVLNMLAACGVLILTTPPDVIINSLMRLGMSPRVGYVLLSVLNIIPHMRATMARITEAQKARGVELEGNLKTRLKSFFFLMGPVILSSLNQTRERALALELRGFNAHAPRTFASASGAYPLYKISRVCVVILLLLVVSWRLYL
ncbi:energy-coupling factor transporter transmembrane component T [Thalassobacillus sp. CUG 92003]|uniref:energy-coupling factor transporter transmembrane component T n=1 Tax=Thalassobacillus sp. CUG 92003 TaxID=2736641 RepID=UPI0015E6EA33|nr:energy-coupling factor transporter transmembrane component T [Thalassobacillus sp. CUG 92003]